MLYSSYMYAFFCFVLFQLNIWDTAGHERFVSGWQHHCRQVSHAVLVYDVTDRQSFINISTWKTIVEHAGSEVSISLVGNKSDLTNRCEVSEEEGLALAKDLGCISFHLVSAKDNENIDECFRSAARGAIRRLVRMLPSE